MEKQVAGSLVTRLMNGRRRMDGCIDGYVYGLRKG